LTRSLFIGSVSLKQKPLSASGADNGFCFFWLGWKIRPLSTPCLAADNYIYYEDDNKANKVGNGKNIFHYDLHICLRTPYLTVSIWLVKKFLVFWLNFAWPASKL
jgi:hypothetical protein